MVAAIEAGIPTLVEAREMITQFHLMIRRRLETGLTLWIERARASLIASFANGVARDEAAVLAAITSSWSNGQTEGQITPPKACQTSDVWPWEHRSIASQINRRGLGAAPK
jgi:transposase